MDDWYKIIITLFVKTKIIKLYTTIIIKLYFLSLYNVTKLNTTKKWNETPLKTSFPDKQFRYIYNVDGSLLRVL